MKGPKCYFIILSAGISCRLATFNASMVYYEFNLSHKFNRIILLKVKTKIIIWKEKKSVLFRHLMEIQTSRIVMCFQEKNCCTRLLGPSSYKVYFEVRNSQRTIQNSYSQLLQNNHRENKSCEVKLFWTVTLASSMNWAYMITWEQLVLIC